MNRTPDPDPQRGPRRYGPNANDPVRPGARDPRAASDPSARPGPPDPRAQHPPAGPNPPAGQYPPSQYQPGHYPPGQHPAGQAPRQYPAGQFPSDGRPPAGYPEQPRYQGPPTRRPDDARPGPDPTAVYPADALGRPAAPPFRPAAPPDRNVARPPVERQRATPVPVGLRPSERPRHHTAAGIVAGRIVAALLSLAVLAGFAFAWGFANNATDAVATGNDTAKAGQAGVLFRGGQNILLIGSDARTDQQGNPLTAAELASVSTQDDGGGINTDTVMIVHVPEGGGKATAVSIPRDTWIPQSVTDIVKGPYSDGGSGPYKPNKINSFYSTAKFYMQQYLVSKGVKDAAQRERDSDNAGRTELQAIVQAFTGLHIDHYAEVNLIGFYTLSNAIGGVPVCLNAAVNDPFSGANFKAGPQDVSGSAAMSFVRQRHGLPGGDLDRVRRQQAFLAGATSKMLSAGVLTSPSKLSSLVEAASRSVILDKGFDLLSFAGQMSSLSGGNVTFTTIPTDGPETSTNQDALATNPAQLKAFFTTINGKAPDDPTTSAAPTTTAAVTAIDPSSVTVDVQNATKINKLAASVSATLAGAGFQAGDIVSFPGITAATAHSTTTISYPEGAKAAAQAVQHALGDKGKLVLDNSIAAGHISVAAGTDMPTPSGLRATAGRLAAGSVAAPTVPTTPGSTPGGLTAATVGCVN